MYRNCIQFEGIQTFYAKYFRKHANTYPNVFKLYEKYAFIIYYVEGVS